MSKKYYAVKKGHTIGIYSTWKECQEQTSGFSGAEYRGFDNRIAAERYLEEKEIEKTLDNSICLIAYIDGSYDEKIKKYSHGCVFLTPKGEEIEEYGVGDDEQALESRNVAGELQGAMISVEWAIKNGYKQLLIKYDYSGIENWANENWKAQKYISKKYFKYIKNKRKEIDIFFEKVKAHSGDEYNEKADQLASKALKNIDNEGKMKYGNSWVTIEGIQENDLNIIIELINEEFDSLEIESKTNNNVYKYIISDTNDSKITITYYKTSYKLNIQGKKSELFTGFISYIVELTDSEEIPKIYNEYFTSSLDKDSIEKEFEKYFSDMPEYIRKKKKFIKCLHAAICFLKIEFEMPEYTSFVFNSYRALEGHLKIILEKCKINCSNGFNMFNKHPNNSYKLNTMYDVGCNRKLQYINKCYNIYHNNRHVFFHWNNPNANIDQTKLITDINYAHKKIKDTLTLINDYYKI